MVQPLRTLVKAGSITASVDVAPFQFPFSNTNCSLPAFNNGSTQGVSGALTANHNGFYGIQYFYGSIPTYQVATPPGFNFSSTDTGQPQQIAGGTVNSFGVFDYIALMPNPALYQPVISAAASIQSTVLNAFMFADTAYSDAGQSNGTANTGWNNYQFTFPSVLFQNTVANFVISQTNFQANSATATAAPGSLSRVAAYVNNDVAGGIITPMSRTNSFGTHITNFLYAEASLAGSSWVNTNYTVSVSGGNVLSVVTPSGATNTSGIAISPLSGLSIFTSQAGSNSGASVGLNGMSISAVDFGNSYSLAFSDPVDQAAYNPQANAPAPYKVAIIPNGGFLLHIAGSTRYLMIDAYQGFYYSIDLHGLNTPANKAVLQTGGSVYQTGFGVDFAGNFWFYNSGDGVSPSSKPILYSTLNLAMNFAIGSLPNISGVAVACKRRKLVFSRISFEG